MAPAFDPRNALASLEDHTTREKERATYNATLGAGAFFLAVVFGLTLPSPWRVINGEWSSSLLGSLVGLSAHGVLVLSVLVATRCAQVQGTEMWEQFNAKYLGFTRRAKPAETALPTDRLAALNNVTTLKSLHPSLSPVHKTLTSTASSDVPGRSFFDVPPVKTVEDGKAYMRRLQQAARERESTEDSFQSGFGGAGGGSGGSSFPSDNYGIYGTGALLPRVYQASGFDPSIRDTIDEKDEDALTTSSNPQVAWAQLEELGLAMFMHLYVRNVRRLLACHVKDFVEAFVQNCFELNECGVMMDVLMRRVPAQALLCPPGQSQQMTNVSLFDMVNGLKGHPAFISKTRKVDLFQEHVTFDKYLNVGEATSSEFSSLERQQYVLERLILLSKDRNLDRFRWNKGSNWKGKEWTDSLPSDSEIMMNVFCCILDNMLPMHNENDRPFHKSYYLPKGPRRPFTASVRSRLFFVQTVKRPPHFKVLAKATVREIVPCDENCFHVAIVYLHALKKMKAGHLESINMHRIIEQVFDISK